MNKAQIPGRPIAGVLVDGRKMAMWQVEALRTLAEDYNFIFYNCTNIRTQPRRPIHFPYYLLNAFSLRTRLTRPEPLSSSEQVFDFECRHEGNWQTFPDDLLGRFSADGVKVILKFGMGLLRIPNATELQIPILSYHHGDPRFFRGRPAGFYELLSGHRVIGQIVQLLSNRLDAGTVVAYAESKAQPHSYRATMIEAYRLSPFLLEPAVRNALSGEHLDIKPTGRVTGLPRPLTVARFVMQRLGALIRRFAYGLLIEKRWLIAVARAPSADFPIRGDFPRQESWRPVPLPHPYRFLADPFFHPDGSGILAEALHAHTGIGQIVHISPKGHLVLLSGGHHSYPAVIKTPSGIQLVPETSEHGSALLYSLKGLQPSQVGALQLCGRAARLLDPTPFLQDNRYYLFANRAEEGPNVLRLWTGPDLASNLEEHPASPICLSPAGGRMGGLILKRKGRMFRLGQDLRGQYGDGLLLFEIEALSSRLYREKLVRSLRFEAVRGPHTLNMDKESLVFDYYRDKFTLFASIRRLQARYARQASLR